MRRSRAASVCVAASWLLSLSNLLLLTTDVNAFSTRPQSQPRQSSRLYISSWTDTASERRRKASQGSRDPSEHIQDYLPAPEAVEARATIEGRIVVSGLPGQQRSDQFLLDLIHHQESAFEFATISLVVPDTAAAKKNLLSRSARYTGLLDALDFVQEEEGALLPTVAQLEGASTWLAVVDATTSTDPLAVCTSVAERVAEVGSSTLKNVAILMTNVKSDQLASVEKCQSMVASFSKMAPEFSLEDEEDDDEVAEQEGVAYTMVAVGALHDGPEGKKPYAYQPLTEGGESITEFSREESYRMITELLQLQCGVNQALVFSELDDEREEMANATETKLIKGLREAGYARMQEMDHMIRKGPKAYDEALEEWRNRHPDWDKGYTTDIWWEAPEYKESRARSDARAARLAELEEEVELSEIEVLAKEWARREYFQQTMSGAVDSSSISEDEYAKTVWDRAMKEGEWAYRMARGELTEEEAGQELLSFKAQQAKKQEVMLKRAKEELAAVMKEDLTDDDEDEDDDDDED